MTMYRMILMMRHDSRGSLLYPLTYNTYFDIVCRSSIHCAAPPWTCRMDNTHTAFHTRMSLIFPLRVSHTPGATNAHKKVEMPQNGLYLRNFTLSITPWPGVITLESQTQLITCVHAYHCRLQMMTSPLSKCWASATAPTRRTYP